ncbi:MAG: HD domain-containing protein [Desulfamplus sp.]|nr:HD domain-containing protein [Desulfamplus sp.]
MIQTKVSIDNLIAIVAQGGKVKTGIDVYNAKGVLLLEKDILVNSVKTLEVIKSQGIKNLPLNPENYGGVWDSDGNYLKIDQDGVTVEKPSVSQLVHTSKKDKQISKAKSSRISAPSGDIEKRLKVIEEIKIAAAQKYEIGKQAVKQALDAIRLSKGEFDYNSVEENVSELVAFLNTAENPFAYLTKEIINYDSIIYSHAVNVCAIGTAILNRFNINFSSMVNKYIDSSLAAGDFPLSSSENGATGGGGSYIYYHKDDILDISTGFFLHDIGKTLIPDSVLNKKSKLTDMEFGMIKKHSYGLGIQILDKNRLKNRVVRNIVGLHHGALFDGERNCYPENIKSDEIPLYVKICKLADMYDAMTSRTCYREAFNPINVVTDIFRKYAKKDKMLQFVLHAFVKSIGIYPTGSVIYLKNGQLAYILESAGPLVLPFTDSDGKTLSAGSSPPPLDLGDEHIADELKADISRSIKTPLEVYELLPAWLKPK